MIKSFLNCFRIKSCVCESKPDQSDSFRHFLRDERVTRAKYFFKKYIASGNEAYLENMWSSLTTNGESSPDKEETFQWAKRQLSIMGPETEYHKTVQEIEFLKQQKKSLLRSVQIIDDKISDLNQTL